MFIESKCKRQSLANNKQDVERMYAGVRWIGVKDRGGGQTGGIVKAVIDAVCAVHVAEKRSICGDTDAGGVMCRS